MQTVLFLTFSESKQAITLPFSTWQLLGGWANLHSSSLREQFPLWNCRHTSKVSHFVSLTEFIPNAMPKGCDHKWDFLKMQKYSLVPQTPKSVFWLFPFTSREWEKCQQVNYKCDQLKKCLTGVPQLMGSANSECSFAASGVHSLVSVLCLLV